MKKGMELSINIIVILVITIAVFAMAIGFLAKIGIGADKAKQELEDEALRQLEESVVPGTKVAISRDTKEVYPGDSATFFVYVLNILDDQATFDIQATVGKAYDIRGEEIADALVVDDIFIPGSLSLEKDESDIKKILVKVPGNKKKGIYHVRLTVICSDHPDCPTPSYDGYPHKVYVDVQ